MNELQRNVVIIGGGPAGLAAAVVLAREGVGGILVAEREDTLGGILRQCIHDGFGLMRFGESLSGPEYAQRFIDEAAQLGIEYLTGTTVLSVTPDKRVTLVSREGMRYIRAKAVVLTMGCRERTRGALGIPGESQVDAKLQTIPGTEKRYDCDTVILSVGLLPENELSLDAGVRLDARTRGAVVDEFLQTNQPGFFAAGNVLHVHDLVDNVSVEAESLAKGVAAYLRDGALPACPICLTCGAGVGHVLPQRITGTRDVLLSMRPSHKIERCSIVLRQRGTGRFSGRRCARRCLPK